MLEQQLLFASHNRHKLEEMRMLLPKGYVLIGLSDIGFDTEIPEPFETFEENAAAKASFVFSKTGIPCFSDDSGLEVDALGGKPGVYSARYAGPDKNSTDNIHKVLQELGSIENRRARFIAVIAFQYTASACPVFRGAVEGSIGLNVEGHHGFGYDPIFIPSGFDKSFAVLPGRIKNAISHRAKAMGKFLEFLSVHK